jgi:hypothetical protein
MLKLFVDMSTYRITYLRLDHFHHHHRPHHQLPQLMPLCDDQVGHVLLTLDLQVLSKQDMHTVSATVTSSIASSIPFRWPDAGDR